MWDPQLKNDSIELLEETVARQTAAALGSVIGLPGITNTARFYEVTIEKNRGAVFVGWVEEDAIKKFPKLDSLPRGIGGHTGTWAIDSYTGSVGSFFFFF